MAQRVPALRPQRIVRSLERCGLIIKRRTGSHVALTKPGLRRPVIIAMHNRELPSRTVRDIVAQTGVSLDEFLSNV